MNVLRTLEQEVVDRLGRVGVSARHAVESILSGQHRSVRRGLSVEFAGTRPYAPGDDLRRLDWLVYARTDRYNVKLYEEETRLRATMVLDCSGSMAFGTGRFSKFDFARMLAATLGFIMVRQGDVVGLALVDTGVREHVPPGEGLGHLVNLLGVLERARPSGETSLAGVLEGLAMRLRRRGLVILVTDALDDPAALVTALRHLRHRRQDVRVFQVLDPVEESFPFRGSSEFAGLEGESPLRLDGDRVRPYYRATLEEHERAVAAEAHIGLEEVRADLDGAPESRQRILRALPRGAPVGDHRRLARKIQAHLRFRSLAARQEQDGQQGGEPARHPRGLRSRARGPAPPRRSPWARTPGRPSPCSLTRQWRAARWRS